MYEMIHVFPLFFCCCCCCRTLHRSLEVTFSYPTRNLKIFAQLVVLWMLKSLGIECLWWYAPRNLNKSVAVSCWPLLRDGWAMTAISPGPGFIVLGMLHSSVSNRNLLTDVGYHFIFLVFFIAIHASGRIFMWTVQRAKYMYSSFAKLLINECLRCTSSLSKLMISLTLICLGQSV